MAIASDCSYWVAKDQGRRQLLLVAIALGAIVGLCGSVIQDLEAPV